MTAGRRGDSRGPARAAAVAAAFLVLVGTGCGGRGSEALPLGEIIDATPVPAPALGQAAQQELRSVAPDPARVRVPAIDVDAPVRPLIVGPDGVLPAPADNHVTGWWRQGPEPGEAGPAVIVGHVDSYRGPAVFFRLHQLRAGDVVHVDRADGSTATFTVERVERHSKDAFPTESVYGDTPGSRLRLVTCGGEFDDASRSYDDNIIAFAVRTG